MEQCVWQSVSRVNQRLGTEGRTCAVKHLFGRCGLFGGCIVGLRRHGRWKRRPAVGEQDSGLKGSRSSLWACDCLNGRQAGGLAPELRSFLRNNGADVPSLQTTIWLLQIRLTMDVRTMTPNETAAKTQICRLDIGSAFACVDPVVLLVHCT
jgi:hypothetical protein